VQISPTRGVGTFLGFPLCPAIGPLHTQDMAGVVRDRPRAGSCTANQAHAVWALIVHSKWPSRVYSVSRNGKEDSKLDNIHPREHAALSYAPSCTDFIWQGSAVLVRGHSASTGMRRCNPPTTSRILDNPRQAHATGRLRHAGLHDGCKAQREADCGFFSLRCWHLW